MGVFALPFLVLLTQAVPLSSDILDAKVLPPNPPLFIKPVVFGHVDVIAAEPRFAAPTRLDKIGRIWAPVTINGKGPFRLVLATGASNSALTPHLVEALGLPVNAAETVMLHGATGSAAVPLVPIESLEVGELLMGPRRLAVLPDALGGADGVLGTEELTNKRIHIDFRHDRITIMRSKNQRAAGGFETIPVTFMREGLPVVDAFMGGVPVKAIVDTGGQTTLGNVALRLALTERHPDEMQEGRLDQIIGSTLDMQVGTRLVAAPLALGNVRVRMHTMTFADFEIFKHWQMTGEPAMLVGMDVIGLLDTLIIDYRRSELQVKLARR